MCRWKDVILDKHASMHRHDPGKYILQEHNIASTGNINYPIRGITLYTQTNTHRYTHGKVARWTHPAASKIRAGRKMLLTPVEYMSGLLMKTSYWMCIARNMIHEWLLSCLLVLLCRLNGADMRWIIPVVITGLEYRVFTIPYFTRFP